MLYWVHKNTTANDCKMFVSTKLLSKNTCNTDRTFPQEKNTRAGTAFQGCRILPCLHFLMFLGKFRLQLTLVYHHSTSMAPGFTVEKRFHQWNKNIHMEWNSIRKEIHGLGWKAINWITTSQWWCGWVQACLQPGHFMDHGSGIPSSAIDMSLVGDDPCVPTNYFNWLYQNRPLRDNFQTQQCPTGKLEIDSSPQQARFWEQENHLPNLHCCITCVETWCMQINIRYILYKHYIYTYVYIVHHGNTICTYECTYTHAPSLYIHHIYI